MKKQNRDKNYYAIVGLLTLAKVHREALDAIEDELIVLTGEEGEKGMGHCGDAIYEETTAKELIRKVAESNKRNKK